MVDLVVMSLGLPVPSAQSQVHKRAAERASEYREKTRKSVEGQARISDMTRHMTQNLYDQNR